MNALLNRVLKAYRPVYQRGLLMDGQYRGPCAGEPEDPSRTESSRHARVLLAAFAAPGPIFPFRRKTP